MRYIDPTLKARIQSAQQTLYNNANPSMEVIAVRARTPITRKELWQELVITESATAVCTSVAVKKTGRTPERVYAAYVDSTGLLTVKSAAVKMPIRLMTWQVETTIAGCVACSLEFEGRFRHEGRNVVFLTDELPFLFYVTTGGALYGGILGGSYEQLAAANVTAIDVINGVSNTYDAQDQGFFLFYILSGTLYYNYYLDGAWQGQQSISIAPANAVNVKAERTFDYRIILHVTDNTGALYEVYGKMEATGWNATDSLIMSVSANGGLVDVTYSENQSDSENISMNVSILGYPEPMRMATYSPTLLEVYNIATSTEDPENPGQYYDDYGYRVVFVFDQYIPNAADYPSAFKLTDSYNATWYGQSAVVDHNIVTVTFTDLNNAGNDITATALASDLWNGYVMLTETSNVFTATGLIPTEVPAPQVVSITNTDAQTIIIEFDLPITSINSQSGFDVSGYEPQFSPDGELISTDYVVSSIMFSPDYESSQTTDLSNATLTDTVYSSGIILAEES